MNDAAGGRPDLRVSDAERDAAMADLGTHFQAGRLDSDEFEERLAAAARARTRSDLDRLLADLPPAVPPQQPSAPSRAGRGIPAALVTIAVVVLAVIVAGGLFAHGPVHMMGHSSGHWHWYGVPWWLILIPVLVLVRILRRFRRRPR